MKLYALSLSYVEGSSAVSRAACCIAVSYDEAVGKGISMLEKDVPKCTNRAVCALEIPLNVLRRVVDANQEAVS